MITHRGARLPAPRDLRLDFFRGLALFSIFIDHIPDNVASRFALQALGLADAAEVFILIAGYAGGMVYGRHFIAGNTVVGLARIYHRVWQLYVAHIFLFAVFLATVAHTVASVNSALYVEELGAADFLREPDIALVKALTLQFQPAFTDILPLYIVLLAILPMVLWSYRYVPAVVLAGSLALWLAVLAFDGLALPAYPGPDQVWLFNPMGWQALFFFSAYLGWRASRGHIAAFDRPWLLYAALAYAGFCFWLRNHAAVHDDFDSLPASLLAMLAPYLDKSDLSPLRLLNVLAWGLIVTRLFKPDAALLSGRLARPFILCGRHSLYVFCLGILLSVIGHFIINENYGGAGLQLAVSFGGGAIMTGVAALMEWFAIMSKPTSRRVEAPSRSGAE